MTFRNAPDMELRHLRYFAAVAEEMSFTKAAQRLRLAQPSLTRQVRNLEDEFGVRLLDRSKNQIALTEEGRAFLPAAQKILAACAESVSAVQRMSRGESPHLNLGYIANVHHDLLPATLAAFRKLSPEVALNLFDMTRAEQYEALDTRKIDLGFVGLRPSLASQELRFECVAHDTILLALPHRHRLAKRPRIKLEDLGAQFFICRSEKTEPGDSDWVRRTCRSAGATAKVLQEAVDALSAIRFVKDGLGISLLPAQIAALPHKGVVFRPLSPPLRRESTIAWRADNPSKPLESYIRIVTELSRSM